MPVTTVKVFTTGLAAVAALGAVGLASATVDATAIRVQPVVLDLPLDPPPPAPAPADLPTAEALTDILTNLTDPNSPIQQKDVLVQGGIPKHEGDRIEHALRHAQHRGELPLTFTVQNITSTGPSTASADVTISGPKLAAPITKTLTFADDNGWMLSHDTAAALIEDVTGK